MQRPPAQLATTRKKEHDMKTLRKNLVAAVAAAGILSLASAQAASVQDMDHASKEHGYGATAYSAETMKEMEKAVAEAPKEAVDNSTSPKGHTAADWAYGYEAKGYSSPDLTKP